MVERLPNDLVEPLLGGRYLTFEAITTLRTNPKYVFYFLFTAFF
jgi:hypothetical protein